MGLRNIRSLLSFEEIRRDARHAFRSLARSPGFSAVAVLTIAIGIGSTTTLFSLVYGVLFRPLPWPEPDRLVRIEERRGGKPGRVPWTISNATYLEWRSNHSTIEDVGAWRWQSITMSGEGEARQLHVAAVTPGLFGMLRARPVRGRLFVEDDATREPNVVLIGHAMWQRNFAAREDIIGRTIRLGDRSFTIVGVMTRGFTFPQKDTDAWMPMRVAPVAGTGGVRSLMIVPALARLRPGVTAALAAAEATARARSAPDIAAGGMSLALFGSGGEASVMTGGAVDVLTADQRPALLLLLGAVVLLFLASTSSVILLQMARAASRRREMAVRMAIGAGIGRVARAWVIDSILLASGGGLAGILLSILVHRLLPGLLPADFPRLEDVRIDAPVALCAVGLAVLSGLATGLVPAFQSRGGSLLESLTENGGSVEGRSRTRSARLRGLLMAGQVAIACALLAGAGLLGRSFVALLAADRGYDPHNVLTARIPLARPATFGERAHLLDAIRERMSAVPGVTDVGFGNALPFVTTGGFRGFNFPSPTREGENIEVSSMVHAVTPSYFAALRLRTLAGRHLDNTDTPTSRPVVVVNRTFASKYLGPDPVGTKLALKVGNQRDWEVVGVVDDMRQGGMIGRPPAPFGGISDPPLPEFFFATSQWTAQITELVLVVRTSGDPVPLTPTLGAIVRQEDASLALDSVMTMDERVVESLARPRISAVLLGTFAICAVTIAMVGLFGILAYTTARRTREIGIRAALGARPRDVAGLVIRQALTVAAGGAAAGVGLAYIGGRLISTLLYGVSSTDPFSFTVAPALLIVTSLVACAIPARRAARVDPLVALRRME
jgi:putative ABC transport system permease protein